MDYIIEKEWISNNGHACVVVMRKMGFRCGYVGIDKKHFLYGKKYNDEMIISKKQKEKLLNSEIGKRGIVNIFCFDGEKITPSIFFDVHGGITYSDNGNYEYPVKSDLWWFGFDCAHAGDAKDLNALSPEMRKFEEKWGTDGVIRSLNYCIKECESLSKQIKMLENENI